MEKKSRKGRILSLKGESGVTLLESTLTMGLMGIMLALTSTIYVNLEYFMGKQTSAISARNESLKLISMIRKQYAIDLIKDADPPRKMSSKAETIEGRISDKTGDSIQTVKKVINTISTISENNSVELFSLSNECAELPDQMKDKIPMFNLEYFNEIFAKLKISDSYSKSGSGSAITDFESVQITCEEYLQGFQCGYNSVPYITFERNGRVTRVPHEVATPGQFSSAKNTAVAAFICDTESFGNLDQRLFKDVTVFIGTYDFTQHRNPDLKKRVKWQKFRSIFSVSSPSENVLYIRDP